MTDIEFDVLDELYFVQSFDVIQKALSMPESELKNALHVLLTKGWIKCFKSAAEELTPEEIHFENEFKNYYYLATKAGLLAHNSR